MAKGHQAPPPAPRVTVNPLAGVQRMPLQQAITTINSVPLAPQTAPTQIVIAPPRPLI